MDKQKNKLGGKNTLSYSRVPTNDMGGMMELESDYGTQTTG